MPAIQVVLFDLGGTLLHYEQPPEHTFDAINEAAMRAFLVAAARAGAKIADPALAVRAVARMAAAADAKAARALHANNAESVIREGLEAVEIHLTAKAWNAGITAYYAAVSAVVTPVAGDAKAVLADLVGQGRSLGMVSNTLWSPEFHDADLQRFGLLEYLPVRVYSSAAGIVKPHPAIYRQALDRLDVAPAEAVFVGDKLAVDVAGPQKIGMRAILVVSPFRPEESDEIQPDARIQSLAELPALLSAWDCAIESQLPVGTPEITGDCPPNP
ncbi:MAG TPA: HAD family hydrolase [Anaerolineae bacterium]